MEDPKVVIDNPHDGPFVDVNFNEWEINNLIECLWIGFRERFPEENRQKIDTFATDAYKVTIQKLKIAKNNIASIKRKLAYRARPFPAKREEGKETA